MSKEQSECWTCLSNSGIRRISPGPTVYEGKYWLVEHAYPTALKGWMVIVLKRHCEALHALIPEEFAEFGQIQAKVCRLLHEHLKCEKEYLMCLAEAPHFTHIHYHVVPKSHDLPDSLKATRIFSLLNVSAEDAIPPDEIRAFCEQLRVDWE